MAAHPHAYRTLSFRRMLLVQELRHQRELIRVLAYHLVRIEDAGLARKAEYFTSDEYHFLKRIEAALEQEKALLLKIDAIRPRIPAETAERREYARQQPRRNERRMRPSAAVREALAAYRRAGENR